MKYECDIDARTFIHIFYVIQFSRTSKPKNQRKREKKIISIFTHSRCVAVLVCSWISHLHLRWRHSSLYGFCLISMLPGRTNRFISLERFESGAREFVPNFMLFIISIAHFGQSPCTICSYNRVPCIFTEYGTRTNIIVLISYRRIHWHVQFQLTSFIIIHEKISDATIRRVSIFRCDVRPTTTIRVLVYGPPKWFRKIKIFN